MQVLFDAIREITSVETKISKMRKLKLDRDCGERLVLRRVVPELLWHFLRAFGLRLGCI